MEQLFSLGIYFIDSISAIGNFLLSNPIGDQLQLHIQGNTIFWENMSQPMKDFLLAISEQPIGILLFGGALVGVLVWRLVSFIIDILP